ncbi:MAG: hypothetical protein KR126chlam3_00016 [Chlamydiae bacterium]|nr:hypothetical protein [Chlamydiota bacterium]
MKNLILACILVFAFGCNFAKKTPPHVINDQQSPRFLYVLNAQFGKYDDGKLTLKGIPSVLYFSDRPNRLAGHTTIEQFTKLWEQDSFKKDPPNGNLSILDQKNEQEILIELSNPKVETDCIAFDVRLLKGEIPQQFKSSALFIDLDSPTNQSLAYENFGEDFHAVDCSCAETSE